MLHMLLHIKAELLYLHYKPCAIDFGSTARNYGHANKVNLDLEAEILREAGSQRETEGVWGDEFNSWPICLFFIMSPWCFLSQSFFPLALHTQNLTHWFTCPTFLWISPSDWLGILANSQSWGVYTAGWPVKGRAHVCVCACACSWKLDKPQYHIIYLLSSPRPPPSPLLPLFLWTYTSHSPKPLHGLNSSFLNYPSLS